MHIEYIILLIYKLLTYFKQNQDMDSNYYFKFMLLNIKAGNNLYIFIIYYYLLLFFYIIMNYAIIKGNISVGSIDTIHKLDYID
jgi:hypothetical protein